MNLVGGANDELWSNTALVRTRYKWTPYSVWLNMADIHERMVYFCGRYYDLGPQLALRHVLRSGGTFVDVGANIGLMTVLGAHAVGPTGFVYAFEPNPDCCQRLSLHVSRNQLRNVEVQPVGLGDTEAILSLTRNTGSSVHGSFAPPADEGSVTARHTASVRRGDDVLLQARVDRPMVIKIDVEGFECRTLRGLAKTIERHRPVILTEVVAEHLTRAQASVAELFDLMHRFGYAGSAVCLKRRWMRYQLHLVRVGAPDAIPPDTTDVMWRPNASH